MRKVRRGLSWPFDFWCEIAKEVLTGSEDIHRVNWLEACKVQAWPGYGSDTWEKEMVELELRSRGKQECRLHCPWYSKVLPMVAAGLLELWGCMTDCTGVVRHWTVYNALLSRKSEIGGTIDSEAERRQPFNGMATKATAQSIIRIYEKQSLEEFAPTEWPHIPEVVRCMKISRACWIMGRWTSFTDTENVLPSHSTPFILTDLPMIDTEQF